MILKGLFTNAKWNTKIMLLIGILVFFMLFSSVVLSVIYKLQGIDSQLLEGNAMLISQAFKSACTFILGALAYVYLISKNPSNYMGINTLKNGWLYAIVPLCILSIYPLVNIISMWNNDIQLPASLKGIEQWMRATQELSNNATLLMLKGDGWISNLLKFVCMAIIPAIGEEFIFRGCMQKGLQNKTGNIHLAVMVTAFVFSFIHFQFYGFLPRLIMGVILGYFFAYGKSLWISIWAHFFNNAIILALYIFLYKDTPDTNITTMGVPNNPDPFTLVSIAVISLLIFLASMSVFVIIARNRKTQ